MAMDATPTWNRGDRIGSGAIGNVYIETRKGVRGDEQCRAVKICAIQDLDTRDNFYERELKALKMISSSRYAALFVDFYGSWMDDQNLYIAMEYISKGDLWACIREDLNNEDAQQIMGDLINGVEFLHGQKLTHRDLKPQNILAVQKRSASQNWWVKITDFGICKIEDQNTILRTMVGTPSYWAPEIAVQTRMKTSSYTNKCDMWSLGCILFNIGSRGSSAFYPDELQSYCEGRLPFNPRGISLSLDNNGVSLLKDLLRIDPTDRPGAAQALQYPWLYSRGVPKKEAHTRKTNCIAFSPKGKLLATGATDKTVVLWDVKTEDAIHTLKGHKRAILQIVFSPNGHLLASSSRDHTIRLWDTALWKTRAILEGHKDHIWAVAFSPNDRLLASGCYDGKVNIWDIATSKPLHELIGHEYTNDCKPECSRVSASVFCVAFSASGKQFASGSRDGTIKLWNTEDGALLNTLEHNPTSIFNMAFSPDGQLASASADGKVQLWGPVNQLLDQAKKNKPRTIIVFDSNVESIAFSRHGPVAAGFDSGSVSIWAPAWYDRKARTFKSHQNCVTGVAFSPDGTLLASVSLKGDSPKLFKLSDLADTAADQ